jgi:hypothetical protein
MVWARAGVGRPPATFGFAADASFRCQKRERKMGKEKFSENPEIKVTEKKSKSKKAKISPPSRRDPSKEKQEDKRRQE